MLKIALLLYLNKKYSYLKLIALETFSELCSFIIVDEIKMSINFIQARSQKTNDEKLPYGKVWQEAEL